MQTKYYYSTLFLVLLLTSAYLYDYQNITFKPSQSIHQWRQTDGISIARNYYFEGMEFFKPQTHNLTSDNGTTGYSATSETPFLNYFMAILYKIFGYNEYFFRLLNMLIYFTGLIYLFKSLNLFFKDGFWPVFITFLAFTSPVLVYYANNFLPNTTALSFVFIALFFFSKFYLFKNKRHLYWMFFWFFLAGSLKITALLSFFAIGTVFFIEWIGLIKLEKEKIFKNPSLFIIGTIVSLGLVFSWILYASHYNSVHESNYFSTTVFPIWKLDSEGIKNIFKAVKENWFSEYFHISIYLLVALCLAYFTIFIKSFKKISIVFIAVILAMGIAYVLLQYSLLKDHDYYMTNIFIIPILIISLVFMDVQNRFPKVLNSLLFKGIFSILLLTNILYAKNHLDIRYNNAKNIQNLSSPFYSITPYLREIGISRDDKVICIPGGSHINLVLMDQKGWSQWTDHKLYRAKAYQYNTDEEGINKCIQNGAKYLIINSIEDIYQNPFLQRFTNNLKGEYQGVLIFDLINHQENNFSLAQRSMKEIYFCDAELRNADLNYFYSPDSSKFFQNASAQSSDYSYSGDYSVCLNSKNPYGMTFSIDSVKFRESIVVSAMILGDSNTGHIIISSDGPQKFYQSISTSKKGNFEEWIEIGSEVFIPEGLHNQNIKIYLYNPSEEKLYFDDLKVVHNSSIGSGK